MRLIVHDSQAVEKQSGSEICLQESIQSPDSGFKQMFGNIHIKDGSYLCFVMITGYFRNLLICFLKCFLTPVGPIFCLDKGLF